jgi:formylglycine-generating enzyme required for sulfatase activity
MRVYISSTKLDLEPERRALTDWLVKNGHLPVHSYVASSETVRDGCLADVDSCDLYVLILGHRYGTRPKDDNPETLSITHLEFRRAGESTKPKPRVAFLRNAIRDVALSSVDNLADLAAVTAFREEVGQQVRPAVFHDDASFITEASTAIQSEIGKIESRLAAARGAERLHGGKPEEPAVVPREYIDWLKSDCASVELLGLRLRQGQAVKLNNVYVPLTTLALPADEPRGKSRAEVGTRADDKPTLLLDRVGRESLYVTGAPGTGKSTFCRWLAWLACEGAVPAPEVDGPDDLRESLPAALVGRLPLLVPLRAFWHRLPDRPHLSGAECERALAAWLHEGKSPGLSADLVAAHLAQGTALLILDGVDEVPAERRASLIGALADRRQPWIGSGNRLLVTSRPYGLSENEMRRLGLPHAPIQPLLDPLQVLLVRRWFRILLDDEGKADATAQDLLTQVRSQTWLSPLMANPLLLTAMCIVFGDGRRLPEDKHELYDRVVDTVLHSRIADRPGQQITRGQLSVVAYGMHTGDGLGEVRATPQAEATDNEIDRMLRAYQRRSGWTEDEKRGVEEARDALLSETGLLLPRDEHRAAFFHLSFQEFLAAQRFAEVESDALREAIASRAVVPEWRNTLSFVVGNILATSTTPERAVKLVKGLIEQHGDNEGVALVAADAVEIFSRRRIRLPADIEDRLRQTLTGAMRGPSPARLRCDGGMALGKIGDPRFRSDAWLLPDDPMLGFVEVPAGPFTMGSDKNADAWDNELPQHPVTLPAFYIAKWPVTVAQFRAFVEAPDNDGFTLEDMDCLRGVPNHPVVSVSWHEALAYSRWLTRKLREWEGTPEPLRTLLNGASTPPWSVTLPSEAEWEKAARGTDVRIYPWGAEADPNRANYSATGVGGTSAVGCFPGGASPYGVEDLSGNVWEWTRSLWDKYPYVPGESREALNADDGLARVVRGGAFYSGGRFVRSAIRFRYTPDYRFMSVGCRLVVSPFRS